jgi:hypothetical protein
VSLDKALVEGLGELERSALEVESGTAAVKDTFGEVMSLTANLNADLGKISVGAKRQSQCSRRCERPSSTSGPAALV